MRFDTYILPVLRYQLRCCRIPYRGQRRQVGLSNLPRQIEFRDELPKGGKLQILRTELRDQELAKLKAKAKVVGA